MMVSAQVLDIAYQAAILRSMGLRHVLAEECRVAGLDLTSQEEISQPEVVGRLVDEEAVPLERLEKIISSLRFSLEGGYRRAVISPEAFQRRRDPMDHEMIGLPGGWFLSGASDDGSQPRWVRLSPYLLGKTPVPRSIFLRICKMLQASPSEDDRWSYRDDESLRELLIHQYDGIVQAVGILGQMPIRYPSPAEWEYAARGPAVGLARYFEGLTGPSRFKDFEQHARNHYEWFFFEFGGDVYHDPGDRILQKRMEKGERLYGYRRLPTVSGGLSAEEVPERWKPSSETTPVRTGKRLRTSEVVVGGLIDFEEPLPFSLTPPADWGPPNALGFHQMMWGVFNVVRDENSQMLTMGVPRGMGWNTGRIGERHPLKKFFGMIDAGLRLASSVDVPSQVDPR